VNQSEATTGPAGSWLGAIRQYLLLSLSGHLIWEIIQTPLYTIFWTAPPKTIAFAIMHCTGGDMLIAISSLVLALLVGANEDWPLERRVYLRVGTIAISSGLLYTVFSEWFNTTVRHTWSYTTAMPVIPVLEVGLTPLLQWVVVPFFAFGTAARRVRSSTHIHY